MPTGREPGWAIAFALPSLERGEVPPEYLIALDRLRKLLQVKARYVRPNSAVPGGVASAGAYGTFSKVPPEDRLVSEERNCWAHRDAARELFFPERRHGDVGPVILEAIKVIVDLGASLENHRQRLTTEWQSIAASLAPFASEVRGIMPAHARVIMRESNIPMIAACIEVLEWPDAWLAYDLCWGMNAVGDLSEAEPGMRETGVFRTADRPAAYSYADLCAGRARPESHRLVEFGGYQTWVCDHLPALMASDAWFQYLQQKCSQRARADMEKAGVTADEMAAAVSQFTDNKGDALLKVIQGRTSKDSIGPLQRLWMAETLSHTEVIKGTMFPPMTPSGFTRWADRQCGGVSNTRPAPRHVIEQGKKSDGTPKFRCIDDDLHSGVNDATGEREALDLISPLWCIWVVTAIHLQCKAVSVRTPRCFIALDDMRHAYRTVLQAVLAVSTIAYYSFTRRTTVFQVVPGHTFGKRASPLNFSRLPRLMCHAATCFLLVLVAHYVDDFPSMDVEAGGPSSSQDALRAVLRGFGWDVEMSKRLLGKLANVVLGVLVNLRRLFSEGVAEIKPVREKIDEILSDLRGCQQARRLTSGEASSFRGRLGWISSAAYGGIGRAATQCLLQRTSESSSAWLPQFDAMIQFLTAVLAEGVLPPLEFNMDAGKLVPVIVYTDASFHWYEEPGKERVPVAVLGFYVIDRITKAELYSSFMLPTYYFRFFSNDLETYISQVELVAAIAVYYTLPHLLSRRAVIHFIDNFAALSALVHGYASKPDLARLVNIFHAQLAGIRSWFFGDWVPSKANPADVPTRPERFHEMPSTAVWVDMVLPPIEQVEFDLAAWIAGVRARAT